MIKLVKKYWPILIIFGLFIIYSFPYLFQNKVPFPTSYIANNLAPWSNYLFGGPVKNGIPDVPGEIFPTRSLVMDFWKKGIVPLWNPYVFSGSPLAANFQSAVFSPLNILFFLLPKIDAWSLLVLLQPILAALFMFCFCRELKLSKIASLFSGIAFMFGGYLTVWGSYTTMGYSVLVLPLILFLIEKFYSNRKNTTLVLIPVVLAFSFFSGHIQTWLYVFLSTLLYASGKLLLDFRNNKKVFLLILFGIAISIPLVAIQFLPTIEFYQFTGRSLVKNDPSRVGIPPLYLITLLAPDFFGNPVTRNDWFGTYAEWSGYIGIITLIFATLAIIRMKMDKKLLPVLLIGIVGLLLAVRSPFLQLLSTLPIPILSNSNPSRAIAIVTFSLAVLAGFGLEQIVFNFQKTKKYFFLILVKISIIIGVLFFITIFGNKFLTSNLFESLKSVSLRNLILPSLILFLIWLTFLMILFTPKFRKQLSFVFLLLVAAEMLRFYNKWTPFDARNLFYPKNEVLSYLKKQNDTTRFYGQFGQTAALTDHLYSLEGYEPLNLLTYSQLISAAVDSKLHKDYKLEVKLESKETNTKRIMDLLGVKYLIYNSNDPQSPFVFPVWTYDTNLYPRIFNDGKFFIFENKERLGRVKLFSDYKIIIDRDEALSILFSPAFDFRSSLILEKNPDISSDNLSSGSASIISYQPNQIRIKTNSVKSSLLFISDNYYPGWKVYVNNNILPIIRTDFTFRSVVIPPGENLVIFKYEPDSFKYGAVISALSAIMLFSILLFSKKLYKIS